MKKIFSIFAILLAFAATIQANDSFKITTTDGKKLTITGSENGLAIEEFKGKVVFLEFFGHNCPPCLAMIDRYIKLQNTYKDKIEIVAVEVQGFNDAELKAFAAQKGINYITVSQDNTGNLIPYVANRAQWSGAIPFLLLMDKKGDVQLVHSGPLSQEQLNSAVDQLLK